MKKGSIIALIVAFVLIIAGGILLVLGLSFAGDGPRESTLAEQEVTLTEPFDNILIDTEDCNVTFAMFSGRADTQVNIREREGVSHSVTVEDGTLKIKMLDSRSWHSFIGVNWEPMEMTVYLPAAEYGSVRVTTASGHIQIPQDFTMGEVVLRSATGKIQCSARITNTLECRTGTGSMDVKGATPVMMRLESDTGKIQVSGTNGTEFYLENDTGRTVLENVSCKILTCESETGDVTLRGVLADEYLQVFTDTGDVEIEGCDAGKVNIETDTGDVSGHFLTSKWFLAYSDTGRIQVPSSRDGGECRIETDTGDIHFE